jgi:hypothetical protein
MTAELLAQAHDTVEQWRAATAVHDVNVMLHRTGGGVNAAGVCIENSIQGILLRKTSACVQTHTHICV